MRRNFFLFLLLFARLWPAVSGAQTTEPIPRFQTISVNEGLSQSSVYAILQDRRGFMWFGTGDGLNRYDGSMLRSYRVPAPTGTLPSSFVRGKLCEDDSGNIWFANEHGLHCWSVRDEKLQTRLRPQQGTPGYNAYLTACTEGNSLWCFSNTLGILRYDLRSRQCQRYPLPDSLRNSDGYDFKMGPGKTIWFKCAQNGPFYYFDTRSKSYHRGTDATDFRFIFFGKKRHYLVSSHGFLIYDSLSRRSTWHSFPNARDGIGALELIEDRWGRAWLGTFNDGLYCYDNTSGQLRHYVHNNIKLASLPIDLVPSLYIDRADNLWVGTDGGGVSRLDLKPPRFHLFPLNEGDHPALSDYFIKCFFEDDQGRLWFGTHSDGFCILDLKTGALENYRQYSNAPGSKPVRIVGAIQQDKDGRMWVAHTFAFSLFDPRTKRFEDIPISPEIIVDSWRGFGWALCPLRDGRMMGGTFAGPVLFSKKNGKWKGRSFIHHPGLNVFITSICQMRDGSVWLATKGPGVLKLDMAGDSFRVAASYFAGLNVRGLHPDEQDPDILWITSSNGLARLNVRSGQYSFKGEADGMSNAYIYGVLEDALHNFWMSTNGGLIFYDRKAGHFTTYTYADGLQSNEFNSGAYLKGSSGRMYFGGIRGFNWFEPDQPADPEISAPGVALMDLRVNGQPVVAGGDAALSLPYTQNNLAFRIAVLDYSRPEANRVACFLEGWDKGWIESHAHEMHYSNLPPGSYHLRVKGRNAAGVWSEEQTLHFTVRAPFWETTLFYALTAFAAFCLIGMIVRYFIRRKLRTQERIIERQKMLMDERTRISKDMHDEIGSGLTRIAMMSESMSMRLGRVEEAGRISNAARNLSQSMSEIIWALNPSHDTLEGLLAYLREQINIFLEPFGLTYSISFPDDPPNMALSNVQRRNLYLTAKEAVGNVLKHAEARALHVAAAVDRGMLRFEVCDDGKGFHLDKVRRSANGLRNMQRRMEEIGGYFDCSTNAQGTRVSFGIPLHRPVEATRRGLTTFFTLQSLRRQNTFGT